jgi:hypothetical protein
MTKKTAIQLKLDPNKAESKFKLLGGGKMDEWNKRLSDITVNALPIAHSKNKDAITEACLAVSYGVMDMAPADPVEGILIAQLMAANEAALAMYQKGWAQPPEYFQARTKYLQLADKAARTVMMLTERLDHHRGRGQQGGFNRSSQHSSKRGCDAEIQAAFGSVCASSFEIARPTPRGTAREL